MCRNLKTLHNFKPLATDEEISASLLQTVRKLSEFTQKSRYAANLLLKTCFAFRCRDRVHSA
ncbi:MAG: DUF2277 family protein [Pyrinomonadaceae bacterium]